MQLYASWDGPLKELAEGKAPRLILHRITYMVGCMQAQPAHNTPLSGSNLIAIRVFFAVPLWFGNLFELWDIHYLVNKAVIYS